MRLASLVLGGLASASAFVSHRRNRNYETHDYYAVHLVPATSPDVLASHTGLEYDGRLDILDDHHIFRAVKHDGDIVKESIERLKHRRKSKRDLQAHVLDGIQFTQKQVLRKRLVKRGAPSVEAAVAQRASAVKQLSIADPIFNEQWHLFNTEQVGNDLNVTGVWLQGITGKNATVCIIDDGLDMDSKDLKANYFAKGSYDFNDATDEPKPKLFDDQHGTRCAGEVAAVKNDACGVGVAYDSRISAVRILSAPISDIDEASAVLYGMQENDIYSCSWGPPDDGKTMDAPGVLIKKAMLQAIQQGRQGKGSIYVFAAGNGAAAEDNCNFDGYTNSIYSVTIGAIDKTNSHPYYSEKCSAQIAVTYSSGAGDNIHTTDVGENKCTKQHGGTSAAGPIVAGLYALVLQIRPDLTWRDIQWITVMSTIPVYKEEKESEWQTTKIGRKYSHQYGYGKVDAYGMIEVAKSWKNVKKQAWYFSPWVHVKHEIPQGKQGLSSNFEITADMLKGANLERVEHVTVTMNIAHTKRGDLSVELHSPSGVISHLSETRQYDDAPIGYVDWTFMTVAHFGETGIGKWTVVVKDSVENDKKGSLTDWRIKLFGESINESIQGMLPMPTENDDKDHDVDIATGVVGTTSVTHNTKPTHTPSSGLPVRPSIAKPTDGSAPSAIGHLPGNAAPKPTATPSEDTGTVSPTSTAIANEGILPYFPTFGVSKRTQIWIYGSLALIIIFCLSLAAYFWIQRRRKLRNNPRDNYEFAMLDDVEETDGMLAAGTKRGRRRRAGELYDAFAGESDEELFSDEDGDYHDAAQDEEFGYGGSRSSQRFVEKAGDSPSEEDEKSGLVR
jgi:kexin